MHQTNDFHMENNQFDEIDEKILQMLAKDGNIPFHEVARACGVSDAEFLFSDATCRTI